MLLTHRSNQPHSQLDARPAAGAVAAAVAAVEQMEAACPIPAQAAVAIESSSAEVDLHIRV